MHEIRSHEVGAASANKLMTFLPKISVVFVTYNRLETLRATLETFVSVTDYPRDRLELIVTDDGSPPDVQAEIRKLPFDIYVLSPYNRGLGANTNAGVAAASGDLILQLQDDWICVGPSDYLRRALSVLQSFDEVGIINCFQHPNVKWALNWNERDCGKDHVRIYKNDPERYLIGVGLSAYSDWPHLKSRAFIDAVGPYKEAVTMRVCELDYARRLHMQTRYAIADIVGLGPFLSIGNELSFNTSVWYAPVTTALNNFTLTRPIVKIARNVKNGWGQIIHRIHLLLS